MAVLCDRATVRDGLMHILGAGVSVLTRETLPAPLDIDIALMATAEDAEDLKASHTAKVKIIDESGVEQLGAELSWSFDRNPDADSLPLPSAPLAVPTHSAAVSRHGRYQIDVELDGAIVATMDFLVRPLGHMAASESRPTE